MPSGLFKKVVLTICIFIPSGDHVSHLEHVGEDELDRLLGIVVDVENLFMCVHKVGHASNL